MWYKIQNFCIGTIAYDWIRKFEVNKYSRSALLSLLQNYEGTDSDNKRIILDNQAILLHPQQDLFYKNKRTFSFETYLAGLQSSICGNHKVS